MYRVVAKETLAPGVHRFRLVAPMVARKASPGQFLILIIDEKGERVPFTISDWDAEQGTVDFVFIEVGRTTRKLAELREGDSLAHVVGPLGRPTHIDSFGHVVCLVSGYGIAAMVPILRALRRRENRITTIVQAPDAARLFGLDQLESFSDRVLLAVRDGDPGANGTALEHLKGLLAHDAPEGIHRVMAMCSLCLMRLVAELTRPHGIPTFLHMTPVMVDGTGMCGACRLQVAGTNRFACFHGPEFDGHKIEGWEVLMARRCSYADDNILQQGYQCRTCSQW